MSAKERQVILQLKRLVRLSKKPLTSNIIPTSRFSFQSIKGCWENGEKPSKKRMNEEIHIAIIDCDTDTPVVAIIKVKREWLHCQLPQWLIDNEEYDYFYEIPDEEDELIEHFLFVYCGYSQNRLHWHIVPADTKFKRLTVKDFQK